MIKSVKKTANIFRLIGLALLIVPIVFFLFIGKVILKAVKIKSLSNESDKTFDLGLTEHAKADVTTDSCDTCDTCDVSNACGCGTGT